MDELIDVSIRATLSLITLFLVTKIIGKKQVSQFSLFDYVIGISIGNFAAEMTINLDSNEINGILAVIIFGLFAYLISYLTMKSIKIRRFFMGTPTMIIENGKILEDNMRKTKLDINDMLEQLRSSGCFDVSQIEYALLEANGKLSILKKSEYEPLTPKIMKVDVDKNSLCANVIIDSKIMFNNLHEMNKDKKWLLHELKVKGYKTLDNIILATLDDQDKLIVYEKNLGMKPKNILE